MNSSLIGKIEKAKRYADEKNRIHVTGLQVHFEGDNGPHDVTLEDSRWHCTCDFFPGWGICSHTMALERVFDGLLSKASPGQARQTASV